MSKNSKGLVWFVVLILLVITLGLGVIFSPQIVEWLRPAWNWIKGNVQEVEKIEDPAEDNGDVTVSVIGSDNVSLAAYEIPTDEYATYGVSATAETAYQLSATITPVTAYNKAVDWSVAFVNPTSEWATGKTVTDYVTVTATSDGALTATVECLQAFKEQIQVTVTSRDDASKTATCVCDYTTKIKTINYIDFSADSEAKHGSVYETLSYSVYDESQVDVTASYTTFTVSDKFTYTFSMTVNEAFVTAVRSQGFTDVIAAGEYVDLSYVGNYSVNALGADKDNVANNVGDYQTRYIQAMKTLGTNAEIGQIKVTATGAYSTYTTYITVYLDASVTEQAVSSVALSDSALMF